MSQVKPTEEMIHKLSRPSFLRLLSDLKPAARAAAIHRRCRTDLPLFAYTFFPDLCRLAFSVLHEFLFERRLEKSCDPLPARRGSIDVVLAPRGSAKSTLVSLIFPIHALLYGTDAYIVLISATQRQATQRLANLRRVLADRPALGECFGAELGAVGRRMSARSVELAGGRIDAFSAGTELRGISHGPWRPTWIILDDAERSDRVHSALHRDSMSEWFNEVIDNLGNGYTNIDVVSTLLHHDALPARLMKRPDARSRAFPSILSEASNEELWRQWRKLYHDLENPHRVRAARKFFKAHRDAMLEGAEVLWPPKEDYYQLQVKRETLGRIAFDKEKQNAPWNRGASIFQRSSLRFFKLEGDKVLREPATENKDGGSPSVEFGELRVFGFLDPAMGNAGGDWAAIATVGVDAVGYLYVLDVWLERAVPSDQICKAFDLHERWQYEGFGLETNAFQKVLLEPFEAERARRKRRGKPWDLPIIEQRHRVPKNTRIMKMEPLVSNGWLLFAEGLSEEFLRQIEDFPNGRHDDGPDAVAAALSLARGPRLTTKPGSRPRKSRGSLSQF